MVPLNFIDLLPNNGLSGCIRLRHSFTSLKARRTLLRVSRQSADDPMRSAHIHSCSHRPVGGRTEPAQA